MSRSHRLMNRIADVAKNIDDIAQDPQRAPLYVNVLSKTQQREKKAVFDGLVALGAKLAFSIPKPGKIRSMASNVGSFKGQTTQNFLKPPGPAMSSQVINPRASIKSSLTKNTRPGDL